MNDIDYKDFHPNRKLFGLSVRWIFFGAVLLIVIGVVAYALIWFFKPIELTNPDNLQRLSREANNAWQALVAKEQSIRNLESKAGLMITAYGDDMATWPQGKRDEYLQLQAQVTNLKTSYNAECGQYNAFWQDEWRALPAPNDIPTRCQLIE